MHLCNSPLMQATGRPQGGFYCAATGNAMNFVIEVLDKTCFHMPMKDIWTYCQNMSR